jgi:Na+-translocating ferredoxin:NAD+ oxidoreductase RnfE subunit
MRKGWDRIKSLVKFIDSRIDPIYVIIVAYLLTITISLLIEVYTTK